MTYFTFPTGCVYKSIVTLRLMNILVMNCWVSTRPVNSVTRRSYCLHSHLICDLEIYTSACWKKKKHQQINQFEKPTLPIPRGNDLRFSTWMANYTFDELLTSNTVALCLRQKKQKQKCRLKEILLTLLSAWKQWASGCEISHFLSADFQMLMRMKNPLEQRAGKPGNDAQIEVGN